MPGVPELPRRDARHKNVEHQAGWLDDGGRDAEQRHHRYITGRTGMADCRVQKRHDKNADRK